MKATDYEYYHQTLIHPFIVKTRETETPLSSYAK